MARVEFKKATPKVVDIYDTISEITLSLDTEEAKAIFALTGVVSGSSVGSSAASRIYATLIRNGLHAGGQEVLTTAIEFKL